MLAHEYLNVNVRDKTENIPAKNSSYTMTRDFTNGCLQSVDCTPTFSPQHVHPEFICSINESRNPISDF
jgi:hypothetical protein